MHKYCQKLVIVVRQIILKCYIHVVTGQCFDTWFLSSSMVNTMKSHWWLQIWFMKTGENITDLPYHISDSFGQNRLQVAVKRQVEFSFFDMFDRRKVKHSQLTWTITQPKQHEDKKRLLSRWNRNEVEARWKALFLTSLTWNPDDGDNKFKQLSNENKITNTL